MTVGVGQNFPKPVRIRTYPPPRFSGVLDIYSSNLRWSPHKVGFLRPSPTHHRHVPMISTMESISSFQRYKHSFSSYLAILCVRIFTGDHEPKTNHDNLKIRHSNTRWETKVRPKQSITKRKWCNSTQVTPFSLRLFLLIAIYNPLTNKSTAQFIIFEPNFVFMI